MQLSLVDMVLNNGASAARSLRSKMRCQVRQGAEVADWTLRITSDAVLFAAGGRLRNGIDEGGRCDDDGGGGGG